MHKLIGYVSVDDVTCRSKLLCPDGGVCFGPLLLKINLRRGVEYNWEVKECELVLIENAAMAKIKYEI